MNLHLLQHLKNSLEVLRSNFAITYIHFLFVLHGYFFVFIFLKKKRKIFLIFLPGLH